MARLGLRQQGRALLFWETLPVLADFFAGRMSPCLLRELLASIFSICHFSKALDRNFSFQSYYYFNFRKSWLALLGSPACHCWRCPAIMVHSSFMDTWNKEALSHGPAHLSALPEVNSQTTPSPSLVPVSASEETQPKTRDGKSDMWIILDISSWLIFQIQ